jgi:hypothetical protein
MTWPLLKMSSTAHAPRRVSEMLRQKVKKIFTLTPRRPLMRRRFLVLTAAALALPVVVLGCTSSHPRYRYKMVVEVNTPQGLRLGESVREVRFYARVNGGDGASVKGEAIAIDLPGGHTLFVLLSGANGDVDYGAWIADWALKRDLSPGGANAGYKPGRFAEIYPTWPRTISPIIHTKGPQLVHFGDIRDPKSVAAVDPAHLDAAFGPGVTLKRITVQVTDEPVTTGIEKRLGWLGAYPEPRLDSDYKGSTNPNVAQQLSHGDFRRGVN